MGLIDELEDLERAKARGEPMGGRTRRRIGVVMVAVAVVLALMASWASSWHVYDFDVVGYGRARVKVGMWDIEVCPDRGDCEEIPRGDFERKLGQLSRSSDAEMGRWLDARWQVGLGLILTAAAAAVLLFCIAMRQTRKVVQRVAIAAFVLGLGAFVLTVRSAFAGPVDFLGFGAATYAAMAGLIDAVVGAALIGLGKTEARS